MQVCSYNIPAYYARRFYRFCNAGVYVPITWCFAVLTPHLDAKLFHLLQCPPLTKLKMKTSSAGRTGLCAVLCVATVSFVSLWALGFETSAPHPRLLLEG